MLSASVTRTVSYAEFVNVYQAVAFANCQGYIVDAALDISWSLHRIVSDDAVRMAHDRFISALAEWLPTQGLRPFFIWAIERGDTYGLHSHVTLSLPAAHEADCRMFLDAELTRLVGEPLVCLDRSSTYRLETFTSETTMHQWRRCKYLLKALDPYVDLVGASATEITRTLARVAELDLQIGGEIMGPRVGVAPTLAHAHRLEWQQCYPMPDMTIDLDHPPTFNDRFLNWYEEHSDRLNLGGPGKIERPLPPEWCRS